MTTNATIPMDTLFDEETESALIGAMLIAPEQAFISAYLSLSPADFFIVRHGAIYAAMIELHKADQAIDLVTVERALRDAGQTDIKGYHLIACVNACPSALNAPSYVQIVHRHAQRRHLLRIADSLRQAAADINTDLEAAQHKALLDLDQVAIRPTGRYTLGRNSIAYFDSRFDQWVKAAQAGEFVGYPMPSDWGKFSEYIPVLLPGSLNIVSGGSGSGKSALLECLLEHFAGIGIECMYMHTEMSADDVFARRMSRHSGVSFTDIVTGKAARFYGRMAETDEQISKWVGNIAYNWLPDPSFSLLQKELRLAALDGYKVILIDHFQDIGVTPLPGEAEVKALERAVTWIANFAESRKVAVILASQENDQGKVKWTRKLVEKASLHIRIADKLLAREVTYRYGGTDYIAFPGEFDPVKMVVVSKNRFGKKGTIRMLNVGARFLYTDPSGARAVPPAVQPRRVIPYQTFNPASDEDTAAADL